MFVFYLVNYNVIWGSIISAVVAAAAVTAFFLIKNKGKKSAADMKPSDKREIILGINSNAAEFSDLYEPLFILSSGKTARKDWVFDSWNARVNSLEGNDEFKTAFKNVFGDVAAFKGKDKKYIKAADKLLKYIVKAGVKRDDDAHVTANETTAEKYDLIGTGSIVADEVYDVFVPFWALETKTTDENGVERKNKIVLSKGAIR